jgi:hypothetical protein
MRFVSFGILAQEKTPSVAGFVSSDRGVYAHSFPAVMGCSGLYQRTAETKRPAAPMQDDWSFVPVLSCPFVSRKTYEATDDGSIADC